MSDSSSSGPIRRTSTTPIYRSSEGEVPEESEKTDKKPVMASKEEKKGNASKRAAYAQSKNTSQTKPSRALPQFQEDHSSSRHTSSTATTAHSRYSSSSSSESDEEGIIPSSEPIFRSASSTTSTTSTSTSSTSVANPEWAQFHQQALNDGGGFAITGDMNIDAVSSWLASSPAGVTGLGIIQTKLAEADFVKLCLALKDNKTLTEIEFFSTQISMSALTDALKVNRDIKKIAINFINIDKEGAKALAAVLKVNRSINELNLYKCALGDEGAQVLAEVLKDNASITAINLDDNDIGNEGVVALAEALEGNKSIRSLDLRDSLIGSTCARALVKAMNVNKTVIHLGLSIKSIKIQAALEENRQLLKKEAANALNEKEAKAALELINSELGKTSTDSVLSTEYSLLYPREVMDQIVDQMAQAGLEDDIINLAKLIKPKT